MVHIPFYSLQYAHNQIREDVRQAVESVIHKNRFVLDTEVAFLEQEYAQYCGVKYCVGLANGLDALYVALKLIGIGASDDVIVPAHTCIATWLAITQTQANIVPVDVDPATMLISYKSVEQAITKKTKAIIPVHLYGRLCNITPLLNIANGNNAKVIEDGAQAHGAGTGKKKAGAFGHCSAFSFYPTKNLGSMGDGGAMVTNDESIYKAALAFRNYGSTKRFVNPTVGINSRLDELQAAILRVKLRQLDCWNKMRRQIARRYLKRLAGVGDLLLPGSAEETAHVYHLFVIRTSLRDDLQKFLTAKGVESMVHYPIPCHLQEAYKGMGYRHGAFPVSESIAHTALSLPIWPGLSTIQIDHICSFVIDFFQKKPSF